MSMNVYIAAERDITVIKTKSKEVQTKYIDLWQTPTNLTYSLIETQDSNCFDEALKQYKEWVLSISEDEQCPIYSDDDIWCKKEPIGVETYNAGKDHLQDLSTTIDLYTKTGWELHFGMC